jgi:hypothetical protein
MAMSALSAYNVDENTIFRRFLYESSSSSLAVVPDSRFKKNIRDQKREEKEINTLFK